MNGVYKLERMELIMNNYESIIIINDSLEEKQKKDTINMVQKIINKNGKLNKTDILGSKKLAYEIRKQKTGYYCVFNFVAESIAIVELERLFRMTDEIVKFITVRVDE
jgi:small subunit ribosomal protein S6